MFSVFYYYIVRKCSTICCKYTFHAGTKKVNEFELLRSEIDIENRSLKWTSRERHMIKKALANINDELMRRILKGKGFSFPVLFITIHIRFSIPSWCQRWCTVLILNFISSPLRNNVDKWFWIHFRFILFFTIAAKSGNLPSNRFIYLRICVGVGITCVKQQLVAR